MGRAAAARCDSTCIMTELCLTGQNLGTDTTHHSEWQVVPQLIRPVTGMKRRNTEVPLSSHKGREE